MCSASASTSVHMREPRLHRKYRSSHELAIWLPGSGSETGGGSSVALAGHLAREFRRCHERGGGKSEA